MDVLRILQPFSKYAKEDDWKQLCSKFGKLVRVQPKIEDLLGFDFKNKKFLQDLAFLTKQVQMVGLLIEDVNNIEKRWNTLELEFKY